MDHSLATDVGSYALPVEFEGEMEVDDEMKVEDAMEPNNTLSEEQQLELARRTRGGDLLRVTGTQTLAPREDEDHHEVELARKKKILAPQRNEPMGEQRLELPRRNEELPETGLMISQGEKENMASEIARKMQFGGTFHNCTFNLQFGGGH